MPIRKSVTELTLEDLAACPVWEFALDEEGVEGQDESTVRPYPCPGALDPAAGMFVVLAHFTLADGSSARGFLTPPVQGMEGLETSQPTIVSSEGHVDFWFGIFEPTAEFVAESYRTLGTTASALFPLHFHSAVELTTGPVEGRLEGFYWIARERRGWFKPRVEIERYLS